MQLFHETTYIASTPADEPDREAVPADQPDPELLFDMAESVIGEHRRIIDSQQSRIATLEGTLLRLVNAMLQGSAVRRARG